MTAGTRAFSRNGVVTAEKMQEVRGSQLRYVVGLALFIDQQGKADARLFTKHSRVVTVAQTNRCKRRAFGLKRQLVFAQLRDVLAAKDSSIVPEKDENCCLPGP